MQIFKHFLIILFHIMFSLILEEIFRKSFLLFNCLFVFKGSCQHGFGDWDHLCKDRGFEPKFLGHRRLFGFWPVFFRFWG